MTAKLICLGIGSLLGGFGRYFMTNFPHSTLIVNVLGCLIIGVLSSLPEDRFFLGNNGRILLMTGFCGAFTTFSALILETDSLVRSGPLYRALGYIVLSCVAGFIVFRLGALAGKLIFS